MYYIIQENLFREEGHDKLINVMNRFDMEYELVTINNSEDIQFITDRKDVFCFGALKLARLSKKYDWYPGCLITENHDYLIYSQFYKENLLNYDSKIIKVSENIDWVSRELFIRPSLDSKIFTGKVFNQYDWEETQHYLLNDKMYQHTVTNDTSIQVAIPKFITQEIRFWIVDGKIVTQSTYRRGSFLMYDNIVDNDAIEFVNKMIDIYCVEKCFTMDVCLTHDGWKIVECGSISCAGFYDADVQKLIMALEEVKWK